MIRYNTTTLYTRKEIIQVMDKIWLFPLTVVESPMGYGKTTAVKEYLKGCDATVLWQTLTEDSVNGFWNGFTRSLKKIDILHAENLIKLGFPTNSIAMDEAMECMESIQFPSPTVMVIDDYHLLFSEDVDKFIEILVKTQNPNLHIVVISRVMFGENTLELALKGYCYVIDRSNLEFSQDEIANYYKLCGINLKPDEVASLYSYTEGWISALYLCMLSFLQLGHVEQQASLYELIEKVVYQNCTADEKKLLIAICIFDNFTLPQAKIMWDKKNAEKILCQLVAKNAFIKYDTGNKTYQMHNIFTSYLREILGRQGAKSQQDIFRAAGEWYVSVKDYIHAMDYFYKAADFDHLLAAIETDKGNSINFEHKEIVIKYFNECPVEIKRKHPIAALLYAAELFIYNEMEMFTDQCEEIRSYIERMQEEKAKKRLSGELELLYSFTKYNDIMAMSIYHRNACKMLDQPSELFDNKASWTFGSPSVLYMFYRQSGELEQEVNNLMECMPYYCHITGGHGSGAECVMQAEHYYYKGDFEQAEISIYKAKYIAEEQRQWAIILCAIFLQMRLAFIKGDLPSVMDLLQQMNANVKQYGSAVFAYTANLCEGFIYSGMKQNRKIPDWITTGRLQESGLPFPSYGFFNIVYGKTLLLAGEYLKLIGISEQFIAAAEAFPNLLGAVYTHIYTAAAHYHLKHDEEALFSLKQGIDIAAADQLVMPFVENGKCILPVLILLEKEEAYTAFVRSVRKLYGQVNENVKGMTGRLEKDGLKAHLTDREREIAKLVIDGLSNRVIAETLNIAEITVKKALQNVYAKVGVGSRTGLMKIMMEQKTL